MTHTLGIDTEKSLPDYIPGFGSLAPIATTATHPTSQQFTFPMHLIRIDPMKDINWNAVLAYLQKHQESKYTNFYLAMWFANLKSSPNLKPFSVMVKMLELQGMSLPEVHNHIRDNMGYDLARERQYVLFQFYRISCGDKSLLTNTPPMHLRGESDMQMLLHTGPNEYQTEPSAYPYHKIFGINRNASCSVSEETPKSPYCGPIEVHRPHPGAYFMLVHKA